MVQGEVIPQVLVFQEFEQTPAELTAPLRAFIAGPCYALFRNQDADEKALTGVGQYDPFTEECFLWPNRPAGAVVDQSFARVFMDDALLRYFEEAIGVGDVIEPVGATKPNQIRSDTIIWSTFGAFAHDTRFVDRGVRVGDTIDLRDGSISFRTSVIGFVNDIIDSVINAAAIDTGNQAATVADVDINQTAGPVNQIEEVADGSAYDGLKDGDVTETYFIEVIQGSVGSDPSTALLRITSASGNDNVASKVPEDFGVPTDIGTRGLTVTFDLLGSSSGGTGIDQDDFVVGQKWTVTVTQAFTPVAVASNTTEDYLGTADTTYVVEVIEGGLFAAGPQIRVTTTTGIDSSGPTTVPASGTEVTVGTKNVTITFTGAGLNKGDKYTIAVEADKNGAIRTLVLGANLPTAMQVATDLEVKLYIKKDIEVDQNRVEAPPLQNWITKETEICLQPGITAFDATWTSAGVLLALPVVEGEIFIHYRALKAQFQSDVQTIDSVGDVLSTLGPITADNPLALGVFKALQNSNGTDVKFMNVESDDLAGHSEVIARITGRRDVYGVTPLTFDKNIQDLYIAHANSASTPEEAQWRVVWVSTELETVKAILTQNSDGSTVLATITDDPDTTGTQFTIVTAVGQEFQDATEPVRAGDIVRALFVDDGFGNLSFTEFVVDAVINNETLRLVAGPDSAITTAAKIEIHRNLTKDEIANELALDSGAFGDRRVRNVFPDVIGAGGEDVAGYFLGAGLAGLRSGVVPQQGLTNVEIAGFDDLSRSTQFFNSNQLTTMAKAGTWIVTQADVNSLNPGAIFTRQQLTTDTSTIEDGEDSFVSNPDSISFTFFNRLSGRIGVSNVTPTLLNLLRTEILGVIEFLKQSGFNERIGGQVIDGELLRLAQHPLLKDRVQVELDLLIPPPLNNLEMRIVFR